MPVVGPGQFARLVGSLDARELREFVADVWDARGWKTTLEGETVSATDGPLGGSERIQCVPARRWRRTELPAADGVDVIVVARETDRLRAVSAGPDARVVGPKELLEMVLYAVDREAAERLFDAHFDRPLSADTPGRPLVARLRNEQPWAALAVGLLVLIAAVLALVGASAQGGLVPGGSDVGLPVTGPAEQRPVGPGTPDGPESSAGTDGTPVDGNSNPPERYPPGLGPSGVTDPDELATAHGQAVVSAPYDLLLIHHGSEDLLAPEREWVSSRQTVDRITGSHYRYRVTGLERNADGSVSRVVFDDYADDTYDYRRIAGSPTPEYVRALIPTGGGNGLFTALAEAYLRRYLATTESRVEVVEWSDRTVYRIVATGTPRRFARPVSDYRAVAVVDRVGRVYSLSVEYTRLDRRRDPNLTMAGAMVTSNATVEAFSEGTVRFAMVYRDVGGTTLSDPPWYDEARNATNATAVDLWPTEDPW